MSREEKTNYIEAGFAVLEELGGGPISTKTLVAAALERGLVGDGKWVYYNFSRACRNSGQFDTSKRGYIALLKEEKVVEEVLVNNPPQFDEAPEEVAVVLAEEEEVTPSLDNPFENN